MSAKCTESNFASLLQRFFTERLTRQKNASPRTISSYRDTFRLFLKFAQLRLQKPPTRIELTDLDTSLVSAFLDHLEVDRQNTIRSRNARFAALRSFLQYAGLMAPTALGTIRGVLAIPMKRFERPLVGYLAREEVEALLNAPDPATWCGQRDRVMLATRYNTGARVSELIAMSVGDVVLDRSSSICIHGKECHSYCISSRRRNETTIIHPYRQACDLAFSWADVVQAVRTGIGLGPYTVANGAGHVGPMSEPYPA